MISPALHAVTEAAEACADGSVNFSKNLTKEHRDIQVAALKSIRLNTRRPSWRTGRWFRS